MKKTVLLYGISMAGILFLLKYMDYRFFVHELSMSVYLGLIAALFTILGVWMGLKLTKKPAIPEKQLAPEMVSESATLVEIEPVL